MIFSALIAVLPLPGSAIFTFLVAYLLFEIGFFFQYHWILIPRANRIDLSRPPAPYRDYPRIEDRVQLLKRIIERLGKRVPADGSITKSDIYYNFIESWFIRKHKDVQYEQFSRQFDMATLDSGLCPPPPPMLRMAWSSVDRGDELNGSSSETSLNEAYVKSNGNAVSDKEHSAMKHAADKDDSNLGRLKKDNMDEFLSWAFFGVHYCTIQSTPEMMTALNEFYDVLESKADMTFEPGRNENFIPRCFTFEEVKSLYRPCFIYAGVAMLRIIANIILAFIGFRQHTCERGLRYWHRTAKTNQNESPFIFFHGIAPGGHAPYLPMIFFGLLRGRSTSRDIFFFENKSVSYSLCFDTVSEEDTVHGVLQAFDRHLSEQHKRNLTFCGHSLGSCQLALVVKSPQLRKRMQNLILIDPVSILLSEPDVMINFLYARTEDGKIENSSVHKLIRFFHETKIHLVASSELFIEHYLRRNFAWYNNELWLADIPDECNVLVCLSEYDEIVHSVKVEREISGHRRSQRFGSRINQIMWKGVGHAHCLTHPDKWSDLHEAMCKMKL